MASSLFLFLNVFVDLPALRGYQNAGLGPNPSDTVRYKFFVSDVFNFPVIYFIFLLHFLMVLQTLHNAMLRSQCEPRLPFLDGHHRPSCTADLGIDRRYGVPAERQRSNSHHDPRQANCSGQLHSAQVNHPEHCLHASRDVLR